jgi:hypothetical protein
MLAAAFALSLLAQDLPAEDPPQPGWPAFSYTFFQVEYVELNVDGFSENPDGFSLAGSVALNDTFHLFGGHTQTTGRALGAGVDTSGYTLGLGAHVSLTPRVDLVGELGLVGTEVRRLGATLDDDGLALAGGLRMWASREVELVLGLARADLERADGDSSIHFAGVLHVAQHVGLVGNLSVGDEADAASVGLRLFR